MSQCPIPRDLKVSSYGSMHPTPSASQQLFRRCHQVWYMFLQYYHKGTRGEGDNFVGHIVTKYNRR